MEEGSTGPRQAGRSRGRRGRHGPPGPKPGGPCWARAPHGMAPAAPRHPVRRKVGSGDAFLAGLVAGWLLAVGEDRLARALRLASVCDASQATGLPPLDWHELALFERQY